MVSIKRCDHEALDFQRLVSLLDKELTIIDGDDHDFYHQFNGIEGINYAVVLYKEDKPVGCGAIKPIDDKTVEIKRMFVHPDNRGEGHSTRILKALENWANELGFNNLILETGKRQVAAIALYKNNGFLRTKNYPPYVGVNNSVCFIKSIE